MNYNSASQWLDCYFSEKIREIQKLKIIWNPVLKTALHKNAINVFGEVFFMTDYILDMIKKACAFCTLTNTPEIN